MTNIKSLTASKLPDRLQQLPQPPKQVFIMGELADLLKRPCVAIVGSRKLTSYGREVTEKITEELARAGITIISGLALGTDSVAHRACLAAGGKTIAVLPTPITKIYPAAHRGLAKEIVATGGALVSEYTEKDAVGRWNFVARNRIIAALADAVLIPEAALKSGSLHTARYALELGREVLAVPGPITSPTSEGTNNLLKHGAIPVTEANDVFFVLGITPAEQAKVKPKSDNPSEQLILDLLASGVIDGAELLAKCGQQPSEFNQTLTMLELAGQIRSLGANNWAIN